MHNSIIWVESDQLNFEYLDLWFDWGIIVQPGWIFIDVEDDRNVIDFANYCVVYNAGNGIETIQASTYTTQTGVDRDTQTLGARVYESQGYEGMLGMIHSLIFKEGQYDSTNFPNTRK